MILQSERWESRSTREELITRKPPGWRTLSNLSREGLFIATREEG
jgi:hypothetical protein